MSSPRRHLNRGFSLIELMIAILLASILLLGITSLFNTTSSVNRTEAGLARLQENGRFALARITEDLRLAGAQYCASLASGATSEGTWTYSDAGRPMVANVDFAALPQYGLPANPAPADPRYWIGPRHFLYGSACNGGTCAPAQGVAGSGADLFNVAGSGPVPALGVAAGDRARAADVLTLRYLSGPGVRLQADFSPLPGNVGTISLEQNLALGPDNLALMTDCTDADILRVAGPGNTLTPAGNIDDTVIGRYLRNADTRVFSFDSFRTVTYYLRLVADPNPDASPGRLISALARRQNGNDEVIAEGVERLDFTYVLEDRNGNSHYLDAQGVHAWNPTLCPPRPPRVNPAIDANCGWRSVRAIEVSLLVNTVADVGQAEESFTYAFLATGAPAPAGTIQVACDPGFTTCSGGAITVLPSGLRPGRMLRREFRTLVTLRNYSF